MKGGGVLFSNLPNCQCVTQLPRLCCRVLVSLRFNDSAGSCQRGIRIYFRAYDEQRERSREGGVCGQGKGNMWVLSREGLCVRVVYLIW